VAPQDPWVGEASAETAALARELEELEVAAPELGELQLLPPCSRPRTPTPQPRSTPRSRHRPQGSRRFREAFTQRKHLLTAERHLRAIGALDVIVSVIPVLLVYLQLGLLLLKGGLTVALMAASAVAGAALLSGPAASLTLGIGVGLWYYEPWARWGATIVRGLQVAACLVAALMVSKVWGAAAFAILCFSAWPAAQLWALHNAAAREVFGPDYRALVRASRSAKVHWAASPFFRVPLLLTLLAIVGGGALALSQLL
jgi:hypothetical protein